MCMSCCRQVLLGWWNSEVLAAVNILSKRVQIVQCLTIHPHFLKAKTLIKLYLVVPVGVNGRKLRSACLVLLAAILRPFPCTLVLELFSEKEWPVLSNCFLFAAYFTDPLLVCDRCPGSNLNNRLSELPNLHLNYEVFEVLLRTIVLLFDDYLALGLAKTLDFSF